jgi:hypothetical protein
MNNTPRRAQVDKFVPAETATYAAQHAVEAMPPDVRLTKAGTLLQEARSLVADFVDGVPPQVDNCEVCKGCTTCTPGNENIIEGTVMCDCCHSKWMDKRDK